MTNTSLDQNLASPRGQSVRYRVARAAGALAAAASRVAGKGSGASIRGQVILKLCPQAFQSSLQGRTILAVTGTNGKTTTTHLLTSAIKQVVPAGRVVTNADGANLYHGIVSALSQAPNADVAVLETDERVVPRLIRDGHPVVLVLLNFSRDQMDRNHEIASLARSWRQGLMEAGENGPVVVANAQDPLVTWAGLKAHRTVWVDTGPGWNQDAVLCPECGAVLERLEGQPWRCPNCDLAQPAADFTVVGDTVTGPDGSVTELKLNVPGRFNQANAGCVLAACSIVDVPADRAIQGMRQVTSPAGRYATTSFGDTQARLLLAKNPAGWAESLPLAVSDPVVLAIDAVAADGKDVSWLWDVDYEQLQGRHVIATGPRGIDLGVRLTYAEVDHWVVPDLSEALSHPSLAGRTSPVDVVSTYTPFQRLRKLGGLA